MSLQCDLNDKITVGCKKYIGVTSGVILKTVPFSYTAEEIADADTMKADLIASSERAFVLVDKDDYELVQQRESQSGNTASGKVLNYGLNPFSFALHTRRPIAYNVRNAFLIGSGSIEVYAIPFTTEGVYQPNLGSDGNFHAKKYTMTKVMYEAADYTTGEPMIRYIFSEDDPKTNVEQYETVEPTDYNPNNLAGSNPVDLTVVSASATEIVATVNLAGNTSNIISTLETANFKKLTDAGVVESVTSTYDSDTGQYTLTGVGMVTGTLQVIPVVTDSIYYESEAVTVIIA